MQLARSVLYLPASNAGAIEKARGLDCDAIILDLEDAVAPNTKAEARGWTKQPKHVFFKADTKQVDQFVEEFYTAGATQG